jgi:hypothetical protein
VEDYPTTAHQGDGRQSQHYQHNAFGLGGRIHTRRQHICLRDFNEQAVADKEPDEIQTHHIEKDIVRKVDPVYEIPSKKELD